MMMIREAAPAPPPPPQSAPFPLYQPVHVAPAPTTDVCSVLSVVFGGVSVALFCFFGWVFGLAAVVLGIVGLVRQKSNPALSGAPMAVIGIVLGAIPLAITLYLWVVLLLAMSGPSPAAR